MQELTSEQDVDEVFEQSYAKAIAIFKHSNVCALSQEMHEDVSQLNEDPHYDGRIYQIVIQEAPGASEYVEEKTGVRHESPQLIVVKDALPVIDLDHYDISVEEIMDVLDELDEE